MKTYLLAGIFSCIIQVSFAQKPKIKLVAGRSPADSIAANASIYKLPDSVLAGHKLFSGTTNFEVDQNSDYYIVVSASGKEDFGRHIHIFTTDTTIEVVLKNKITGLENVTIISKKPFVTQEDDKTVVDAEALSASSTNAFEILEKTPGLIADQDGNVYLNSGTPATIQLNGREVKLSTADLASLLKSLPATSVLKIEILRSPSARYDASGTGGIVNIVLKKGIKPGTNGTANTGYFQGKYATAFAGFSLNSTGKKTNKYISYQFTKRNNYEELTSQRQINLDTALAQASYTTYPVFNNYVSAGLDYSHTSRMNIAYDLRISANNNKSYAENNNQFIIQTSGDIVSNNKSFIRNRGTNNYASNEINTKYKIDTIGSEWTSSAGHTYYNNKNSQGYENYFIDPSMNTITGDGNTKNIKNILRLQSDLVLKLKYQVTIESGVKGNFSRSSIKANYFYAIGSEPRQVDDFQTNTFHYKENILAAYLQVAKKIAGLTIKPGIRIERTDITGRQTVPADTTFQIERTDAFPYVYLRHTIVKLFGFTLTGNAIYRRSISRPYYEVLNPYRKYIDQFLFETGNPQLLPQFTTNYEFNIMAEDYPVFSVGVNKTRNIFTSVTYSDSITKIAYRTYDNLGENKEIYLRMVGGIPPGKKYFFYAGAQHNLNEYKGHYQRTAIEYKRGSWVFFMYHNYKITDGLNITLNGFMRLRGLQNFYELKRFGSLNSSINKSVLKKKGNIILSANDIFATNKVDFEIEKPGISARGSRMNDTRRIGITFRYNIGLKPKEDKKEMYESPESKNE